MMTATFLDALGKVLSKLSHLRHTNWLNGAWYTLKKAVFTWLDDLLTSISPNMDLDASWLEFATYALLAIAGLFILATIAFTTYMFISSRAKKNGMRNLFGETISDGDQGHELYEKGKKMAQDKAYKDAIRVQYVGLLLVLESHKILHVEESWTHYEICEALETHNFKDLPRFKGVGDTFNKWCYGPNLPTEEDYNQWLMAFEVLWKVVNVYEAK